MQGTRIQTKLERAQVAHSLIKGVDPRFLMEQTREMLGLRETKKDAVLQGSGPRHGDVKEDLVIPTAR